MPKEKPKNKVLSFKVDWDLYEDMQKAMQVIREEQVREIDVAQFVREAIRMRVKNTLKND